jgi:nucleoside-diphosphate-sugar epimerase
VSYSQDFLQGALAGTLNVFRQVEKAGIMKIIYTSSLGTVLNPSGSLTDKGKYIEIGLSATLISSF